MGDGIGVGVYGGGFREGGTCAWHFEGLSDIDAGRGLV
jgi:hypothetical protein